MKLKSNLAIVLEGCRSIDVGAFQEMRLAGKINADEESAENLVLEEEQAETNKAFDFKVFPNPSNGNFSVLIDSKKTTEYNFDLINSLGLKVYSIKSLNTNTINIDESALSKGIYYIRISYEKS